MKRILAVLLLFTAVPALAQERAEPIQEGPRAPRAPGRGRGVTPVDEANAQQTQQHLHATPRGTKPASYRIRPSS